MSTSTRAVLAMIPVALQLLAALPEGVVQSQYVTGLTRPTQMAFAPDGRLFVCEKSGALRIVKDGVLLAQPFMTLPVNDLNERGLLSVAFDPNFAVNNYIYVFYSAAVTPVRSRVSRFTANGDFVLPGTEKILLEWDASNSGYHNGGALQFGTDGRLYIAVGENNNSNAAQSLNSLLGKILRINTDGTIPTDNPFYTGTTGDYRSIWYLGLRNPWTFAIEKSTGVMFIADVGAQTWEEINRGNAPGSNYGWPIKEGISNDPNFMNPVYAYHHSTGYPTGCAVIGAAYYNTTTRNLPDKYYGKYFFGDNCNGWIRVMDPVTFVTEEFASPNTTISPADFDFGPDGALYYTSYHTDAVGDGKVFRIAIAGDRPAITVQPQSQTVSAGQPVTFSVGASGSAPLSYQWQRNGANISGATLSSYTINSTTLADNGARFRVVVSNSFGEVTSNEAVLTVTSNRAPTATILTPPSGTLYVAGTTVTYSGEGTDPEDGTLPASAFTWEVTLQHDTHFHPFIPPTSGSKSGSFLIPTTGHTESNVWYRIHLTVKDSGGLTHSVYRDILPQKSNLTFTTNPAGLQITLEGQPKTTPYTETGVVGIIRKLGVVSPQTKNGVSYVFKSWSDGKSASHDIVTPATNTSYTATFVVQCANNLSRSVAVVPGAISLNPVTGRYVQSVVLTNISSANLTGPISLALDRLSSNASLFGAAGTTTCAAPLGSPYAAVSSGADNLLSPNESTSVTLEFINPSHQPITYTPRVLGGPGAR